MQPIIEVHNITKNFRVYYDKGSSLKEKILFKNRNRYEERVVLNNISFNVNKGEALGLIGKNGCGKSTTLKLLNKIMYPDSGEIKTKGRISSLIELGAGFHPDMSGRENIYTNASIFGLNRRDIDARIASIIKFSEMEEYLDNPVRTYSSGMYMRLAFSIAINVDADILLIDEILGVGDISFQAKCFEKLREIKTAGTTIVIVSHSLSQLEQICDRTIWFENGKIKEQGIPKYVHEHYMYGMEQERLAKIEQEFQDNIKNKKGEAYIEKKDNTKTCIEPENEAADSNHLRNSGGHISIGTSRALRRGNQIVHFTDILISNENGKAQKNFRTGDTLLLRLDYESTVQDIETNVGYAIYRDDGLYCYGTNCIFELERTLKLSSRGTIIIKMDNISFLANKYFVDIAIQSPDGIEYDNICFAAEFHIMLDARNTGVCRIENKWSVCNDNKASL